MKQALFTVWVFTRLNTKRFFRDKLAIFFGILFPLIFLFVFGFMTSGDSAPSFNVAIISKADNDFSQKYVQELKKSEVIDVKDDIVSEEQAAELMGRGQLDATIVLPEGFGAVGNHGYPTGQAEVRYTQNNEQAGKGLTTALQGQFAEINRQITGIDPPLTVQGIQTSQQSLQAFDYVFAGLLGFAIVGMGIFGPINVFPELKKQGILRRLHTTPLKVWQYFLSTMASQAIIGLVSLAVMFAVAITVFDLNVTGNYLEIGIFTVFGIVTILGIGLAIGGWAKNERQAAPLGQIIVFPLLFLSGAFFPRFIMPQWLQDLTYYLPLTPVIDGLRLLSTEGKHLIDLGPQLGMMAAWTLIIYFIAFKLFRWE